LEGDSDKSLPFGWNVQVAQRVYLFQDQSVNRDALCLSNALAQTWRYIERL